jgi:hypothetical protein
MPRSVTTPSTYRPLTATESASAVPRPAMMRSSVVLPDPLSDDRHELTVFYRQIER